MNLKYEKALTKTKDANLHLEEINKFFGKLNKIQEKVSKIEEMGKTADLEDKLNSI